jgi:hypothetical protein
MPYVEFLINAPRARSETRLSTRRETSSHRLPFTPTAVKGAVATHNITLEHTHLRMGSRLTLAYAQ